MIRDILLSYYPSNIDKTSEIFSSLVSNEKGNAAIESELNDVIEYMKEWYSNSNVYNQSGDFLDKTINFFTFLERFSDETDKSLKNRFSALFVRNGDTTWGTPNNIKNVFSQYFSLANVYIAENTGQTDTDNLIIDGDFSELSDKWVLTNAIIDKRARFSKSLGVVLEKSASIKQIIDLDSEEEKSYFLHFFMIGKCKISVKKDTQYWNTKTESWTNSECFTFYDCEEWNNVSLWFRTDSENVEISIIGNSESESYVDYVRLYEKKIYPSFTVICQFEGNAAVSAMALAKGESDPTEGSSSWYANADYYDHAFLTGAAAGFAKDIYNDLLNYLKASGVKAYLEILTKDYEEGE